jgi:quercetin dioxygenase-like cupin family protein
MGDGYFVPQKEAGQVEIRSGILRRTLGTTDEVMLCEFHLTRGMIVQPHSHHNDQVGYVVKGKLAVTIGDETHICEAGDSYAIPGGVTHYAEALMETVTVDAFSPPRKDYRTEAR